MSYRQALVVVRNARMRAECSLFVTLLVLTATWWVYAQESKEEIAAVRKVLRQAIQLANNSGNPHTTATALQDIAKVQAAAGEVKESLETVNAIQDALLRDKTLGAIASILLKAGDLPGAWQTLNSFKFANIKAGAVEEIAKAQTDAGDIKGALQTVSSVGDDLSVPSVVVGRLRPDYPHWLTNMKPAMLRYIALAQLKTGDIKGSLQTSADIKNAFEKAGVLQAIGTAQAKAGDSPGAFLTFHEAVKITNSAFDARQRPPTLQAIVKAQVEAGDIHGAMETATSPKESYQKCVLLREVALVQARAGDGVGAKKTFQQAIRTANGIYEAVALKQNALSILATAQADTGDVKGSLQTADSIDNASWRGGTLSAIATAQVQSGNLKGALQIANNVVQAIMRPGTLRAIALAQLQANDIKGALATADSIETIYLKVDVLRAIAKAQAQAGDGNNSVTTLRRALAIAETLNDPFQKADILDETARSQASAGEIKSAVQTVNKIENPRRISYILRAIAAIQAKAGDKPGAAVTFQQALHLIQNLDKLQDGNTLLQIAKEQAEAGDFKQSRETADSINNARLKETALGEIVNSQANVGDIEGALQTASGIETADLKAFALRKIAKAQAAGGDMKGALTWALKQDLPFVTLHALLGVSEGAIERRPLKRNPSGTK